jgi:urease accessory protein UreE
MPVLRLFRPLPIVEVVYRADALPESALGCRRDTMTLGWEDRLKARARRRSDSGLEFATALDRGTALRDGDFFVLADAVVEVVERHEPVVVIEPRTPAEWGLFAYHIGNSHQPLMISERRLVCADTPGMREVLEYHGIPFSPAQQPFTPVGFNGGHQHRPAERP